MQDPAVAFDPEVLERRRRELAIAEEVSAELERVRLMLAQLVGLTLDTSTMMSAAFVLVDADKVQKMAEDMRKEIAADVEAMAKSRPAAAHPPRKPKD